MLFKNELKNLLSDGNLTMPKVTIDSLLTTPIRRSLAEKIEQKAVIYKKNFDLLTEYCDSHLDEPGCMAATITARHSIEKEISFSPFQNQTINELALVTARSQIELEEVGMELADTGIDLTGYLELCRRVLDRDLPGSEPILVPV